MYDYPKAIKRLIRQYEGQAYERELHRELEKLDRSFTEWRNGEIDSGELSQRIHKFEVGPSRKLYSKYDGDLSDLNVAHAVGTGLLKREELPPELLEALERQLAYYESKRQG